MGVVRELWESEGVGIGGHFKGCMDKGGFSEGEIRCV